MSQLPHQTPRLPHKGPLPAVDETPAELVRNAATLLALIGSPSTTETGEKRLTFKTEDVVAVRELLARAVDRLDGGYVVSARGNRALAQSSHDRGAAWVKFATDSGEDFPATVRGV